MSYYDEIADGYNELHRDEQLKKLKVIKENLKIKKTDRLLDVGCGTGISADIFECIWTGVDPSIKMAGQSKKKIVIGRAQALPFEDCTFDVVISVTAIHNFEDIRKGLLEMKRVGGSRFAFSILKKSKNFAQIKRLVAENFKIKKEIEEEKDVIFISSS